MPLDDEQDAPFQLPFSPPDCSYSLVIAHEEKASSARSATSRYFELRGLVVASVEFLEDSDLRAEIERALANPKNNLNINIIRNYKAEIAAGTPYTVVFECEFSRLIPIMETLWTRTKRGLITQQFLVWTLSDSEAQVEGAMLDGLMSRMNDRPQQNLRDVSPMPDKLPGNGFLALQEHGVGRAQDRKEIPQETAPVESIPTPRIQRLSTETRRFRSQEDRVSQLPKDYQVPPDIDENVMGDVPDDDDVDYDSYMASDEELAEAAKIWKRAVRKKLAEKERTP